MKEKIAILGGGNLGASIAEGLIQNSFVRPKNITVTRRKIKLLDHLKKKGVQVVADNCKAISMADIIIVAVKPKQCLEVLEEIRSEIKPKQILVSVVTGVTTDQILETIGKKTTVFRVMPNTAIAIQESMSCISSVHASKTQINSVSKLFASLGKVALIEEELMNASTALGACGIAFALRFIRAATQGGIEIGFDSKTAELVAAQTVKGAASLLLQRGQHPEREIDLVTTPQGCTIAGLNEMEHQGFSSSLIKGIVTSFRKI